MSKLIKYRRLTKIIGFSAPVLDQMTFASPENVHVDIIELDRMFAKYDREYNAVEATYKGEQISLTDYIIRKYGPEANKLIEELL